MRIPNKWRPLGAMLLALTLAVCGGSDEPAAGDLVSADAYAAPAAIAADSRRLIHWMKAANGQMTKAATLLFVPRGTVPAAAMCSASESVTLDGGLTADGFVSNYVGTVASLVGAGFAVVAPDLEVWARRRSATARRTPTTTWPAAAALWRPATRRPTLTEARWRSRRSIRSKHR